MGPQTPESSHGSETPSHDLLIIRGFPNRIPSLDGLRAFSIALVYLAHVATTHGAPYYLDRLGHVGNLGVKVFFVISGYLITTLLLKEWAKTGRINLGSFYLRRTLRIFPAFYAYIALVLISAAGGWVVLSWADVLHAVRVGVHATPNPPRAGGSARATTVDAWP